MSHVHDTTKDWHTMPETPIQTPPVAIDSPRPTCSNDITAEEQQTRTFSGEYAQNSSQEGSSLQQQQHQYQQESDAANRLSGMIAHSQPATPHPDNGHVHQEQQSFSQGEQGSVHHAPTAATSPSPLNNVRGRSGLFANEIGPVFGPTESVENIYSFDRSSTYQVHIQSKIDRGFFRADNDWTCYRRNYFQISGVFSIHGGYNQYYDSHQPNQLYVQDGSNQLSPINRFLMGISARVANSDKEVELIQHTPKRDKGPQYRPEPKPLAPGGNLTLSSASNSQNIVTFERLQYKTATANNGKRRAAQQYYVCQVDLYAHTESNQLIKVATSQSSPLVVRGRSPGHYADTERGIISASAAVASAQQQQQRQDGQRREHVFTSYTKPITQQQQQHELVTKPPPPMMKYEYSHSGPSTSYPYYHQAPAAYPYPPINAPTGTNSNVSSPISHPPLSSPYAQHAQVPHYAVHEVSANDPYAASEFHQQHHEEQHHKMMQHYHMQQTPMESPHYDWQRARYNSSSSGSSSAPSPGPQPYSEGGQGTTYFTPHHSSDTRSSTYSPTTPTYNASTATNPGGLASAVARKYAAGVPYLMNKQMS